MRFSFFAVFIDLFLSIVIGFVLLISNWACKAGFFLFVFGVWMIVGEKEIKVRGFRVSFIEFLKFVEFLRLFRRLFI